MADFAQYPSSVKLRLQPFKAHVSDKELDDFKHLIKLSKVGPQTYENSLEDRKFGITRKWLAGAKHHWESKYDWRKIEERINSFPNFTTTIVDDDGIKYTTHFAALFSKNSKAVPLLLLHGWPGSFLEFLDMLDILRRKYTPDTLPYHVIVTSAIGCAWSSGPPLDKDFKMADQARILNKLMTGLFNTGYISQGGDTGSILSRILAVHYEECKGIHLNLSGVAPPKDADMSALTEMEKKGLERGKEFTTSGNAYAREQGTRPGTIGLVLSSSPVAMLAWIGEKFLEWTDEDPPLDDILDSVSLYWLTDTYAKHIYHYREMFGRGNWRAHGDPAYYCKKPLGFSYFPKEIMPVPKSWIATTGDLVWFKEHDKGGHFAAMEKPQALLEDIESFISQIWPGGASL